MKKYIETIVTVIITFVISLVLNSISTYITQDQGMVKMGSTMKVNNQEYLPLDIETYSSKTTNGLLFAIPSVTLVTEIVSSHPLNIEEIPAAIGISDIKYMKLSDIEPSTTVQLLIPITSNQDASLIRLTNQEQLRFSVVRKDEVKSPLNTAVQEALKIATISSLLYGIVLLWMLANSEKRDKEWKENLENSNKEWKERVEKTDKELKADLEKMDHETQEKMTELKRKVSEGEERSENVINQFQRVRLLLLARLSDYGKELDFWRDTIRKILYESKADERTVERIFDQVTKSLKTYSVQEREVDFNAIETLANILNENKKATRK